MDRTSTVVGHPGGPTAEVWPLTAKVWVEIMVDLLQGSGDQQVEGAGNYLSEACIRFPGTGVRGIVSFHMGAWN